MGDLGNILTATPSYGLTEVNIVDNVISLDDGANDISGRVIVVHAGMDDLGKAGNAGSIANGNAGPRVACGIIKPWLRDC